MNNQSNKKSKGFFLSLLFIGLCAIHTRADSSIYQTLDYARYSNDTQIELVIKQIDSDRQIRTIFKQILDSDHFQVFKTTVPKLESFLYTIATSLHFNSIVKQILKSNSVLTTGMPLSYYRKVFSFHQSQGEEFPLC